MSDESLIDKAEDWEKQRREKWRNAKGKPPVRTYRERDIPFTFKRKAGTKSEVYRYQLAIPASVQTAIGKTAFVKTWPKGTPISKITIEAERLKFEHKSIIARAKAGEVIDDAQIAKIEAEAQKHLGDPRRYNIRANWEAHADWPADVKTFFAAVENGGKVPVAVVPLAEAYRRDKAEYGMDKGKPRRDEKPIEYAIRSLVKIVKQKDIRAISRQDIKAWIAWGHKQGHSPATIKRRAGPIKAIINRFNADHDLPKTNLFYGLQIGGANTSENRLPFHESHEALIQAYLRDTKRVGPETRNLLTLMKWTGCAVEELGGLLLADVNLTPDEGLPYFWIRENKKRGTKTGSRLRVLPLVGPALDAMTDTVTRARVRAKGLRMDEAPLFKSGIGARSAAINKAIRAAGVPKTPRLSAYSYRHNMKEGMRMANVPAETQRRVLGHAGRGSEAHYGATSAGRQVAADAILAAMEHFGKIDRVAYKPGELPKSY